MSKTILLADDSVTIQKVIELTFMDQDYEVVAVSNGDEALERLASITADLVIADVHMPGASGYEVARRAKDRHPEVPVLLLVGTFEPFDKDEMTSSGADSHLKKPFDSQELLQLVERLMETTEAAAPETSEPPAQTVGLGDSDEELEEVTWSNLDLESMEMEPVEVEPMEVELEEMGSVLPGAPEAEEAPVPASPLVGDDSPFELTPVSEETPWPPSPPPASASEPAAEPTTEPFRLGDEDRGFDFTDETPADEASWEAPEEVAAEADEKPAVSVLGFRAPAEATVEPELAFEDEAEDEEEEADAEPSEDAAEFAAEEAAAREISEPQPAPAAAAPAGEGASLSDEDVERIARRVAELLGDRIVREVAWEVIPDLAEVTIKARIAELEEQVE